MILPNYIGIIINHYKDPYEPTSVMESSRGFLRGSIGFTIRGYYHQKRTINVTVFLVFPRSNQQFVKAIAWLQILDHDHNYHNCATSSSDGSSSSSNLVESWKHYPPFPPKTNMTMENPPWMSRCISDWTWGSSNVMLVFRGVNLGKF